MVSKDVTTRLATLTWMMRVGLSLAAVGLVWMFWPVQESDASYIPGIERPTFEAGPWPLVLIDEGHLNTHTQSRRLRPLVRLMARDGFRVAPSEGRLSGNALRGADVLVSVNPLGYTGLAQHAANLLGMERVVRLEPDAFSDDEVGQVVEWIEGGGALLLAADHAPAGLAARKLAAAFGIEMTNWWVEDRGSAEIAFTRANGGLAEHSILNGRNDRERVNTVTTFTGQSLRPPPGATVLLRLSAAAREYPFRQSTEAEGRSAEALAQAVALRLGRGRVVVLGEAAAISAQSIPVPGGPPVLLGMNRPDTDNEQFVLNSLHWLVGLLD